MYPFSQDIHALTAEKALRTLLGAFSSRSTIRWLRAREQPT
jgi:hypothetical protein